jgi:hypothetical protein
MPTPAGAARRRPSQASCSALRACARSGRGLARLPILATFLASAACSSFPEPAHPFSGAPGALAPELSEDLELVLGRLDRAEVTLTVIDPATLPLLSGWLQHQAQRAEGLVLHVHQGEGECEPNPQGSCTNGSMRALTADGREVAQVTIPAPQSAPPDQLAALLWLLGVVTLVAPAIDATTGTHFTRPPEGTPPSEAALQAHDGLIHEQRSAGLYQARTAGGVESYGRHYLQSAGAPIRSVRVDLYVWFGERGDRTRCTLDMRTDAQPLLERRRAKLPLGRAAVRHIQCRKVVVAY